jgi:heavy metal sensor kinase
VYHATERGDCVLVGQSIVFELEDARQFAGELFLGGALLLLCVLAGAWLLMGRALQPVDSISAAAHKIASGDLSQRINVADTDSELGKLAAVLNSTFSRLESSFAQQRQFTSDASHELRTPISVLISEAQTTLARERTPDDYRETITACLDTAQRMRKLTESLLQLARLDAGQEVLQREVVELSALVQDCVKLVRPLAATRKLHISCELSRAETYCDATRIAQVVTNLLTNAITYNNDGGEIRVVTRAENGKSILTVADTGQGIKETDVPRVFERFYRADKSRTGGNTGLGLAISKAIIDAHGGAITVVSTENMGTTFTIRLPSA